MIVVVAERRRLLIDSARLQCADDHRRFGLEDHESRYLRKVLRLKHGAQVDEQKGINDIIKKRLENPNNCCGKISGIKIKPQEKIK